MKENFLDECKERVFESLRGQEGTVFQNSYDLVDTLSDYIADDIIYYSETKEMREKYPDELKDGWETVVDIFDSLTMNPFDDSSLHEVCRAVMESACRDVADGVIPEFDSEQTVDKDLIWKTAKNLDRYITYPFSVSEWPNHEYPYEIKDSHYYRKQLNEQSLKEDNSIRLNIPKSPKRKSKGRGL